MVYGKNQTRARPSQGGQFAKPVDARPNGKPIEEHYENNVRLEIGRMYDIRDIPVGSEWKHENWHEIYIKIDDNDPRRVATKKNSSSVHKNHKDTPTWTSDGNLCKLLKLPSR